jgi:hypothetical protein
MSRKRKWTPEMRADASVVAKARWAALPEDERERRRALASDAGAKGHAAYTAKYPERVELSERTKAAIESGALSPLPCSDCGLPEAKPEYDYEDLRVAGWSHYACRKARA